MKQLGKIDFLRRWSEVNEDRDGSLNLFILPDELYLSGLDLASRVDHSAFFMLRWNGQKLIEHGNAIWPHVDYPIIAQDVRDINERIPQHRIAYDETGNIAVGSLFGQDLEAIMEPIHMTNPMKIDAVNVVKFLSQLGMLELEPDGIVIGEIEEQQKVFSEAGAQRYEHPSGVHDDLFWGLALACYTAVETIIGVAPAAIETAAEAVEYGESPEDVIEGIMQHYKYNY